MKACKQHPLYHEDIRTILSVESIGQLLGKHFLITGATGMVGIMLVDALMSLDKVKVTAVGRSREKAKEGLGEYLDNPNFEFLAMDVRNPFPENLSVDYIIPLASNTHPLAYSQYPVETIMINVLGAKYALELAARCGATLLYPSTNEIYGNALADETFVEDYNGRLNLSNARSCYNESKRVCEALCQSYIAEHGVNVKIARLCRIFGPTMLASDTKASSQFVKKAVAGEDIVLKSNGEQFFSYTYVADSIAGLLYVLLHGENGKAYNVSSEKTNVKLKDFARLCAEISGTSVVFDIPDKMESKGYSIATKSVLDNTRIKELGFVPKYEIEDAIRRTITMLRLEQC